MHPASARFSNVQESNEAPPTRRGAIRRFASNRFAAVFSVSTVILVGIFRVPIATPLLTLLALHLFAAMTSRPPVKLRDLPSFGIRAGLLAVLLGAALPVFGRALQYAGLATLAVGTAALMFRPRNAALALAFLFGLGANAAPLATQELAFKRDAARIPGHLLSSLPVIDRGRIKPFETLAREASLELGSAHARLGVTPVQLYLGLMTSPKAGRLRIHLRKLSLLREIQSGAHFARALFPKGIPLRRGLKRSTDQLLREIRAGAAPAVLHELAFETIELARAREYPDALEAGLPNIRLEERFERLHPFFAAGALDALFGALLLVARLRGRGRSSIHFKAALLIPPLAIHVAALLGRARIVEGPAVTSAYELLQWIAFGTLAIAIALLYRERDSRPLPWLCLVAGGISLLAEKHSLALGAPIGAGIRFTASPLAWQWKSAWLPLHVLSILLAFSTFTVSLVLSAMGIGLKLFRLADPLRLRRIVLSIERLLRLGVASLVAGLVLGAIWADQAWGRIWAWDAKETWSIAVVLAFAGILYARHEGWLRDRGTLAAVPAAYATLLVTWFGIASALHGFASVHWRN